jgi:hypothetical protein
MTGHVSRSEDLQDASASGPFLEPSVRVIDRSVDQLLYLDRTSLTAPRIRFCWEFRSIPETVCDCPIALWPFQQIIPRLYRAPFLEEGAELFHAQLFLKASDIFPPKPFLNGVKDVSLWL